MHVRGSVKLEREQKKTHTFQAIPATLRKFLRVQRVNSL